MKKRLSAFRLSEVELLELKTAAFNAGQSLSGYIRKRIFEPKAV